MKKVYGKGFTIPCRLVRYLSNWPYTLSVKAEELERLYKMFPWPEDPYTRAGRERYESARRDMERLVEHPWVVEAIRGKERPRVLDLCGGTGIGGVALASALLELGHVPELHVLDLRGDALEVAERFGEEELGFRPVTHRVDALAVGGLGVEFDLVVLYGLSTPHFDPWSMSLLCWSVGRALSEGGVFVVEESDRGSLLFERRYRDVLVEGYGDESVTVSLHVGYDPLRGRVRRALLELPGGDGPVYLEAYVWDLAGSAALIWS